MADITDLGLFVVAGLLLNITPGPDLLYIVSRSAVQGRRAGVVAALGIGSGCLVHIFAAAFGLSVILLSSALLFRTMSYVGAAYLLYLGIITLMSAQKKERPHLSKQPVTSLPVIFRQAVLINALNPKVALFFLALLPQFVRPGAESPTMAFLLLGLIFNLNGTLVNIVFALLTSSIRNRIEATEPVQRLLKSLAGIIFLVFGIRLAFISS